MNKTTFLTVDEVAEILRVDRTTLYRWCHSGHLPALKIGKEWRITQSDFDAFLSGARSKTAPATLTDVLASKLLATEHVLALLSTPEEVWSLEVSFFRVAAEKGLPMFKGCWWQHPDDVRQRYAEAGLPVASLESSSQLAIHDCRAAYRQGGQQAVVELWRERGDQVKHRTYWGSGSYLPDEWNGDWSALTALESNLHRATSQLNVVAMCPVVMKSAVCESIPGLLQLTRHHTATLLSAEKGEAVLLRASG